MKKIYLFFFLISLNYSVAQDGTIDTNFSSGAGNYSVNTLIQQIDGKIFVGGSFTLYNGIMAKGIVKLNSDGSTDNTFNSGSGFSNDSFIASVEDIFIQQDGKIIVAGSFNNYNGNSCNRICRLNPDGSFDNSFIIGSGFSNGPFNCSTDNIVILPSEKLLITGTFISYNGTNCEICRLNSDGTYDSTSNYGNFNNYDDSFNEFVSINDLKIQSDGKILAGGNFTHYNGTARRKIVRINNDGTIDNTFTIGNGFNDTVTTLSIQSDGKIIVGGSFTSYNGSTTNRIIRLNINGTKDNTFNIGSGFLDGTVNNVLIQMDGKIIITGSFSSYKGVSKNRIVRLNVDGSIDSTFNIGSGFNNYSSKTSIQSDGKLLIGGGFTSYNGTSVNRLIRLNNPSVLSNSDFSKSKISLYPNPVNEILNLDLSNIETIENLTIYDVTGKNVLEIKDISNHQIDVSSLEKGVYFIDIKTQNGSFKEKFVKN